MPMSDVQNILILGEADSPIVQAFQTRAEQVGYTVTAFLGRDCETVEASAQPYHGVINCHTEVPDIPLLELPDFLTDAIHPKAFCLTNSLAELASDTAGAFIEPGHVTGFSAVGLYRDTPVVECCKTLAMRSENKGDVFDRTVTFLESLNLTVIEVPETPALILGRIVAMLANEAASALMEGVATAEDIDNAMRYGTNYPQGPLAWADQIGLDVVEAILNHLYQTYKEERYRPMLLLQQKVLAGELGVKTGQGFYSYQSEAQAVHT